MGTEPGLVSHVSCKTNQAALSVARLGCHQGLFLQLQGCDNRDVIKSFLPTYNMDYSSGCSVFSVKPASPLKILVAVSQVPPEPSCSLPSLFPSSLSFTSVVFCAIMSRVLLVCLSWCYSSSQRWHRHWHTQVCLLLFF